MYVAMIIITLIQRINTKNEYIYIYMDSLHEENYKEVRMEISVGTEVLVAA